MVAVFGPVELAIVGLVGDGRVVTGFAAEVCGTVGLVVGGRVVVGLVSAMPKEGSKTKTASRVFFIKGDFLKANNLPLIWQEDGV